MNRVTIVDASLEVEVRGTGEPVVLIQTGLTADELAPVAELLSGFTTVLYHRRGYGGSSPAEAPGSIARDALDCQRLLTALGLDAAHIVGLSYSGAVAMQLASTAPRCVRSVCLIEPPPVHTPHAAEFRRVNDELAKVYQQQGSAAALDHVMQLLVGPDWRAESERLLPNSVAQMERDAGTFFGVDLPALLSWHFDAKDAARITQPVRYIGGTASGPWFAAARQLISEWLPHRDEVIIAGADHSLALTHTAQVATAIAEFVRPRRSQIR